MSGTSATEDPAAPGPEPGATLAPFERLGEVAAVLLAADPGGAMGAQVCAALDTALDAIEADRGLRAVVLTIAGAEGGGADPPASLGALAARIEASAKPVIACLEGALWGAGLELALAAHWRLAGAGASFGFPDIVRGLLPEAGGTQRLPRLCGARVALDLLLSGRPVGAEAAEAAGLVDGVLQGDVADAALRLAGNLAEKGFGRRPTLERRDGFADPAAYIGEVARRRQAVAGSRNPAEPRIVDCVEAAFLLPADEGLLFEHTAAGDCRAAPESRALRHAARAERRAAEIPERAAAAPALHLAGVAGGDAAAAGLAVALLDAGLPVVMIERDAEARDAALARVEVAYATAVESGRLGGETALARLEALVVADEDEALAGCDIILAAPGAPAVAMPRGALHMTLNPDLAEGDAALPGLHFLGPVRTARAVEVAVGADTPAPAVAAAFALVARLGRIAVRSGAADGLIGNRVYAAALMAGDRLLAEGAGVEEVDEAMRGAGFGHGPYQLTDLAGLDDAWAAFARRRAARDPALARLDLGARLVEGGRLGRRTGRGYYRYAEGGGRGQSDPVVAMLLAEERAKKDSPPRNLGAAEIRRRLLAAMANEGARLVAEGVALRPSDVDVVMLHGFGFPRWLGGPMQWADEAGLLALRDDLRRWAADDAAFWTPVPLWDELIKNGRRFADL